MKIDVQYLEPVSKAWAQRRRWKEIRDRKLDGDCIIVRPFEEWNQV